MILKQPNFWVKVALITALLTFAILSQKLNIEALEKPAGNPLEEPVVIRATCYTADEGSITSTGIEPRYGYIAGKPEWAGMAACLYSIDEDGSIGELIGIFQIKDTGYGIETGQGQSKLFSDRTLGSIETGQSIDVYQPTMHAAEEWINTYGDHVYLMLIDGKG